MISLAGRDILHAWGRFVFTGLGLGLLIGVTLTMAGVYRGMVDDAKVLLDKIPAPTDAQIRQAMATTLCRCMTYYRVQAAIKRVAKVNA